MKSKARAIHLIWRWQKTGPTRAKFLGTPPSHARYPALFELIVPADGYRWLRREV